MKQVLGYGAVGVIAALLLAEAILRWGVALGDPPLARLDPVTEYELVRAASYRRWGNEIAINSHGMRAPEHPARPEPEARHVLVLGDSVVYGGHFLDQGDIISAQLEQGLSGMDSLQGCRLRVLPMAVSSWGPVNQAAFLERDGSFGADVAAIVLSAHDLYDVPRIPADIIPYRTRRPIGALGDVLEAVWERSFRRVQVADTRPLQDRAKMSLAALDRIADLFRSDAIPFVVIYHPTTSELDGALRQERDVFRDWAGVQDVAFVDLSPEMSVRGYRDHIHPNAEGARQIATVLRGVLSSYVRPCAL